MNPFASYIHEHDITLYYGTKWPNATNFDTDNPQVTKFEELYWTCRYNPDKDKGLGNKVYFKSNNSQEQGGHKPRPRRHLGCGRAGAKMAGPNHFILSLSN